MQYNFFTAPAPHWLAETGSVQGRPDRGREVDQDRFAKLGFEQRNSLLRDYRDLDKGRRRLAVVDDVAGDPDIRLGVVGEYWVTAVGIARTTRKVAAGDIDLDPIAGADGVMYVSEVDGQLVNAMGFQGLRHG